MSQSKSHGGPIANMSAIKTAIANNEVNRLKELLNGQALDTLQKEYLADLAQLSNQAVRDVIANTPEKSTR